VSTDSAASLEGLLLQAIGTLPLALLSFLLSRSITGAHLRHFWRAWACLTASLFALYLSQHLPAARALLEPLYFLGELAFAWLIVEGCRSLAAGADAPRRRFWLLLPVAAAAVGLAHAHPDFTVRFVPQAAALSVLFALALRELRHVPPSGEGRIGVPLLRLSLVLLVVHFAHYVPVLAWSAWRGVALPGSYARYTSIFDLLLETLLGFGTLIVVMEREHLDLEAANAELRAARERLEAMARVDPLTSSLNRHAFYSMVEGNRTAEGASGCVAVVDLDALKPINDELGHAAGDAAIRAVARAVRQVVRADDLVFRWGGDEFLAVIFGVSEEEAHRRLHGLDAMLAVVPVPGSPRPVAIAVSFGVAAFTALAGLERALETADERMYRQKQAKRSDSDRRR
jgi:diguanylate cyclase (GGDEF)-like protein